MSRYQGYFAGVLAGAVLAAGSVSISALAAGASPPVFAANPSVGWYSYRREFIAPASGPGPVMQDPKRPHITNDDYRVTGQQPTPALADLDNPILQPWARDVVKKRNDLVLAGEEVYSPHASCWPIGIPSFLLQPMTRPMFIVQGPKEVVMILTSFNDVRRIHLTDKHSANLKPSWYGESIGHYDGDTLVVDTIGLNDKTNIDGFGTPHTTQLHVIERWHLIDNGQTLEVNVHVEDPGAFTMPWNGIVRYRMFEAAVRQVPVERLTQLATPEEGPLTEAFCPENPRPFFPGRNARPVPQADKPDF